MTESAARLPALREKAEKIIRDHDLRCAGDYDVVAPWCSVAPNGTPLCKGCAELRDKIEAALRAVQEETIALRASECDALNTELRENYGSHIQVTPADDWRSAIRALVDGVRYGCEFQARGVQEVTRAVCDWQSIETAPKDGTVIRVHCAELLDEDFNKHGSTEAFWQDTEGWKAALWDSDNDAWYAEIIQPTHWMPLPDPPKRGPQ